MTYACAYIFFRYCRATRTRSSSEIAVHGNTIFLLLRSSGILSLPPDEVALFLSNWCRQTEISHTGAICEIFSFTESGFRYIIDFDRFNSCWNWVSFKIKIGIFFCNYLFVNQSRHIIISTFDTTQCELFSSSDISKASLQLVQPGSHTTIYRLLFLFAGCLDSFDFRQK